MGTKSNPGAYDCYANAEPDEPIFILLGRDPHAPDAVFKWADDRETLINQGVKPKTDLALVNDARECAAAMIVYRESRLTIEEREERQRLAEFIQRLQTYR